MMANIIGTSANDTLIGTDDNDSISGLEGNDSLEGMLGDDTLRGGLGNDTLEGGAFNGFSSKFYGDEGNDLLAFSEVYVLDNHDSSLYGSLYGGSGNDTLNADGAAYSYPSNISLFGEDGNDSLLGNIFGPLSGGGGNDTLSSYSSSNTVSSYDTSSSLSGGAGNDSLISPADYNNFSGDEGNDTLTSTAGDYNTFSGGAGNDYLYAIGNDNYLSGDEGNDTVSGFASYSNHLSGGAGNDNLGAYGYMNELSGGVGNDTLSASGGLRGGAGDDSLIGDDGYCYLSGDEGNDTLIANDSLLGNDFGNINNLSGGTGNDSLIGGGTNNTYNLNNDTFLLQSDTISSASTAIDKIIFSSVVTSNLSLNLNLSTIQTVSPNQKLTFTSGTTIENVIASSGNDSITGNSQANNLNGAGGNDTLIAGGGDDALVGNTGNDSLDGGSGNNIYGFNLDSGYLGSDTIASAAGAIDTVKFDSATKNIKYNLNLNTPQLISPNLTLTVNSGTTIENVIAGSGNDSVTGNALANNLNGKAGNDTLIGGGGADHFVYATNAVFSTTGLGVDSITDFTKASDQIQLSKTTFIKLTSAIGNQLNASDLAVVTTDAAAAVSSRVIVYNSTNGNLFYNENGTGAGFGTGAQFANLANKPILAVTDFSVIA